MKKILFTGLTFLIMCVMLCVTSYAEGEKTGEYVIAGSDGQYKLFESKFGTLSEICVGSISSVLQVMESPSNIIFDSITVNNDFELPKGKYNVSGKIAVESGAKITVSDGSEVTFFEAEVTLKDRSYIRIKGGRLETVDTVINANDGNALKIDYSASSSVTVKSGLIHSCSESPTIEHYFGSLSVLGGTVLNEGGSAILCKSELSLGASPKISGVSFDIETQCGINLSKNGVYFLPDKHLKVKYFGEFQNGSMTELFYLSDPGCTNKITLVSESGKEYPLTYFESSVHTDEKNFLSVYLPYTVGFFDGGKQIYEEKKLRGETVDEFAIEEKTGYSFVKWYKDEELLNAFSFDEKVNSDMKLYAEFSLNAPEFTISSLEYIYDGKERQIKFDTLDHPLYANGGFYTFEWYKNGQLISSSSSHRVKEVKDSGSYSCILTFNYLSDSVRVDVKGINVDIKKAPIYAPDINSVKYTGREQFPEIPKSELYSYNTSSYKDSGNYYIELTLTDHENYYWAESNSTVETVKFEIMPADNGFITELRVSDAYYGTFVKPYAKSLFGDVYYVYAEEKDGEYKEQMPTSVGDYYVKAMVKENKNYLQLCSEPVMFSILQEEAVSLSSVADAIKKDYYTFEKFDTKGLSVKVVYNSGREETVRADNINCVYQNSDCFLYGDNGIIISYEGISFIYPVNVKKSEYDISGFDFDDIELEYDGKYHSFIHEGDKVIGKDGMELSYTSVGGGTDAGKYEITVVFSSNSKEYLIPKEVKIDLNIKSKPVTLEWENTLFVYDGKTKSPKAGYIDVFGIKRFPAIVGAAINASEEYTASAYNTNQNYAFLNPDCKFGILKADFDLSKIVFDAESHVYDGSEKTVTASGLPSGIEIIGYTDNRHTECGIYRLTAAVSYDKNNYNPPPAITYEWRILPAEYDMSSIVFSDTVAVYDGVIHYPVVTGKLPIGIDGSTPKYFFSGGVIHVREGRVAVEVCFESGSKNYKAPDTVVAYVEILPKGITADWTSEQYVYNGKIQHPFAFSDISEINILNAGTDAGTHTVKAECVNTDYYVINDSFDYIISKADNYFVKQFSIDDIYESEQIKTGGEALFGSPVIYFYSDPECNNKIEMPYKPGVYYSRCEVSESKNYNVLISDTQSFRIIEVIPVEITASLLKKDLSAFEELTSKDIYVLITYNDGNKTQAQNKQIEFEYQNGNSLRKNDTIVYILCENMKFPLPIDVGYAEYDMGKVSWNYESFVYDGETKMPELVGLPDGVLVKEYIGGGINAGKYTVEAILDYDLENYKEPKLDPYEFYIEKCVLSIPKFEDAIYCAKPIIPTAENSFYEIEFDDQMVNAGKYTVNVLLNDSDNYAFEGVDGESVTVDFCILPITLKLEVSDYNMYLFSEKGSYDYKITEGEVLPGEKITLKEIVDGERVILISENPNYSLEYESPKINMIDRLDPKTTERIIVFVLLCVLLILIITILVLNREKIRAKIIYYLEKRKTHKPIQEYYLLPEVRTAALPMPSKKDQEEKNDETVFFNKNESTILRDAMSVDASHADELISDSLAKDLLKRGREAVYTSGYKKEIINVEVLSKNFKSGDRIDANVLKHKGLIDKETAYIKILAGGEIDKPLSVYANDFSLAAIKMIALTGGEAIKVITVKTDDGKF